MVIDTPPLQSSLDPEAVASLRDQLKGDAYLPGDDGFAAAVTGWAALIRHTPAIAVMPETAHDVTRAMAFARLFDLPVGVLGTGHGVPVPCDAGVLINMSRMRSVSIYPERQLARVEGGATWEDVVPLAHEQGLAPLCGSSSGVGVVGYTIGGGHGWLTRKYGRAADRVVAADVVTATGELLHVSADSHPDLFWALRGASGNFGIVTSLEFGLVPVRDVFGGSVMYPLAEAPRVFKAFLAWSETLSEEVTTSIAIMRLPAIPTLPPPLQGAQVVVIRACAVGDLREGEAAIAPMRALGTPLMDSFGPMPFTAIDAISMDPKESMPAMAASMMLSDLDESAVDALLEVAGPGVDSPLVMIEVRDYRRIAPGDAPRGAGAHIGLPLFALGVPFSPEVGVAIEGALAGLREAMRPFTDEHVLLNLLGDGDVGPERTRAAFLPEDFARLQEIKRSYDPTNRFRFNHNIAP